MTTEKAIKMIDEYLLEPNSIHKDWVECLRLCRQALVGIQGKTNYDRIRNMSVDEMAEIIKDVYFQGYVDCLHDEGCVERKEVEQWLESEVDTE